jgi:hypothetical protein
MITREKMTIMHTGFRTSQDFALVACPNLLIEVSILYGVQSAESQPHITEM